MNGSFTNVAFNVEDIIELGFGDEQIMLINGDSDREEAWDSEQLIDSVQNTETVVNSKWSEVKSDHIDRVRLCEQVMWKGYINAWGARIPLETNWNLELLASLLEGYEDKVVVDWLRYGWPISRPPQLEGSHSHIQKSCKCLRVPGCYQCLYRKRVKKGCSMRSLPQGTFQR